MRRILVFVVVGVALLAVLLVWFSPSERPATAARSGMQEQAPAVLTKGFEIKDGRRVAGPAVVSVTQGTLLELQVVSDRDDELHVHGYDRGQALSANEPGTLRLKLDRAGRFEVELHGAHRTLTTLEVSPQ
jgi:hypothetical protein